MIAYFIYILFNMFFMQEKGYNIFCAEDHISTLHCGDRSMALQPGECYTQDMYEMCLAEESIVRRMPKNPPAEKAKSPLVYDAKNITYIQDSPRQEMINNCRMFYRACKQDGRTTCKKYGGVTDTKDCLSKYDPTCTDIFLQCVRIYVKVESE